MKIEKKYLYIAAVLIFLLVTSFWLFGKKNSTKKTTVSVSPTEAVIPTIDSSVKVSLTPVIAGKELLLSIENIPSGTKNLEYVLSYETVEGGIQGVNSLAEIKEKNFQKKITLGTCSSGTCVYHQVKGKIKLELKFTGNYGERIFEKEYEI